LENGLAVVPEPTLLPECASVFQEENSGEID